MLRDDRPTIDPAAAEASPSIDIQHGIYASADLAAETHFVPVQRETIEHVGNFAMRMSLGFGKRF